MTLEQLQERVARRIGLDTSDADELEELNRALNEGYEDVLVRTRCRVDYAEMAATDDEWIYRMDEDVLATIEVWVAGEPPMQRVTSPQIIEMRRLSTTATDGIRYYATEGHDTLLVHPAADATISTLYVPRPTALSSSSDVPVYVPSQWHRAIALYAMWQMADYDDDGSSQAGQVYRVEYEGADGRGGILRTIRQSLSRMGGRRLGPMRVGRRSAVTPTYPSVDA